jgi:ribosomal protein S18 acetylase RimI-like enzyme
MTTPSTLLRIETPAMALDASLVPWDSQVFGFPVACIQSLDIRDPSAAAEVWERYLAWADAHGVALTSVRLPHGELAMSMFLERRGFRFIEMVLHPVVQGLQRRQLAEVKGMTVSPVSQTELPEVVAMAESAFGFERYHVDPRLSAGPANQRYGNWVRGSFAHPKQKLLKIQREGVIAGFFVVEVLEGGDAYWHLTAMNPEHKGKGWASDVWTAILGYHKDAGIDVVRTTISARNTPVLGLYSKLNFRFNAPEMTFHWLRADR